MAACLMPGFSVEVAESPDEPLRLAVLAPLQADVESKTGPVDCDRLAVALRDERGGVVGGAWGGIVFGWLYTEILVVPAGSRGMGLGTRLMHTLEQQAARRGCHAAWVDTFSFQAPAFYEKLGYLHFGRLDDFPAGSTRYFLWKPLEFMAAR